MINHALVRHLPTGQIGKVIRVDIESKSYMVSIGVDRGFRRFPVLAHIRDRDAYASAHSVIDSPTDAPTPPAWQAGRRV